MSERLLVFDGAAVLVKLSQPRPDRVTFQAEPVDPSEVTGPGCNQLTEAGEAHLEEAIARLRFATGVDDDLSEMAARFRDAPLIGQAARTRLHIRHMRRPFAREAFAWGVAEQLIDYRRAASF